VLAHGEKMGGGERKVLAVGSPGLNKGFEKEKGELQGGTESVF